MNAVSLKRDSTRTPVRRMTIADTAQKPKSSAQTNRTVEQNIAEMQANWSEILTNVAEKSQKLLNEFMSRERDETIAPFLPPSDPGKFQDAFFALMDKVLKSPEELIDVQVAFWKDYIKLCRASMDKMSGKVEKIPTVISPARSDKRFKDEAWNEVWVFDFLKQSYLLSSRYATTVMNKAHDLDPQTARKAEFFTRQIVDAMSPSNFWITNPEVLRTTIESKGDNLVKGLENLLADLERGNGELVINMSDKNAFNFGENIATTPGKVVYQNELMQLLQFSPTTEQVHKVPLLIIPPWINKYYILDLRDSNSMIRYLVSQGHTVFCLSWINPDEKLAHINFDDYMELGALDGMRQVANITGENSINIMGYCIGGTLTSSTLAYLKALGNKRPKDLPEVMSVTYLAVLVDFADPGELGVFIDENQIGALETRMDKQGFLGAATINLTFNLLRANDLLWSFVVNNYLLGREPFPFDLLTWNSDTTNLPAAMHSFYLRNMYLENNLIKPNAISMKGVPIDIHSVNTPSFIIGMREDHITPWRSIYSGTQVYQGPVTFILSQSGHVAGAINPPSEKNKYGYWTNSNNPKDPNEWLDHATEHKGSWWPEWMRWLAPYAGDMIPARHPGENWDVLEDAPGSYVLQRAI